jgi:hypothetical protein
MSDRAARASNECHSFERPPTWNEFRPTLTTALQHCSTAALQHCSTAALQHWIVELRGIPSFVAGAGADAEAVATNTHAAPTPP